MKNTTALTSTLNYITDNILGLDKGSPLASVVSKAIDGKIIFTIELGGFANKKIDAIPFDIDIDKIFDLELIDLEAKVQNLLSDTIEDLADELRDFVRVSDRVPTVILTDLIEDVITGEVVKDLKNSLAVELTDAALGLDLPDLSKIGDAFENAFDRLTDGNFDDAALDIVNFYATMGLGAFTDTLRDNGDIDESYIDALSSIGDGFLLPEINALVDSFLSDDSYEFGRDRFINALEGAVFNGLILDDFEEEILDDIFGLDGGSEFETNLAKLFSDQAENLFKDALGATVDFFAGDLNLEQFDFGDIFGSFDPTAILSSIFSAFTAQELANLVIDIDSIGEDIASKLGGVLATSALGDTFGALALEGVAYLFGEAAAGAIGATIFQGLGAALTGGLGLIAGSLIFEGIDWLTDGWLSGIINKLFGGGGSPQAWYIATFDAETGGVGVRYHASKDTEASQRNAVADLARAYESIVEDVTEYVDVDLSYTGPSGLTFAWKHDVHGGSPWVGSEQNPIVASKNGEYLVRVAANYTLNRITFDQDTMRGKAFEIWKANMIAENGGKSPLTSPDALAALQLYMTKADVIAKYVLDPTPIDQLLEGADTPAAIAFVKDLLWAVENGLLDDVEIAAGAANTGAIAIESETYRVTAGRELLDVLEAKGEGLSFALDETDQPAHGKVVITEHGGFQYVAEDGFVGEDHITFIVTDRNGVSVTHTVYVTVDAALEIERSFDDWGDTAVGGLGDDAALLGDLDETQTFETEYGVLTLLADSSYRFQKAAQSVFRDLKEGETKAVRIPLSDDVDFVLNVKGNDDAPIVSGVTHSGMWFDEGQFTRNISIADIDADVQPTFAGAEFFGVYGWAHVDDEGATWTYQVYDVPPPPGGTHLSEDITFTASDGTQHTVRVWSVSREPVVEPTPDPVEPTPDPVEPTPDPVEPTPDPVEPTPDPIQTPNRMVGTNDADRITGTAESDMMIGKAGDDVMRGRGDADTLRGGGGEDKLIGNRGDDHLRGGGADDLLKGGGGADKLIGNRGDDHLRGGGADDLLKGGGGADKLAGGGGKDALHGGGGKDALHGGGGDDALIGGGGADTLDGGRGQDLLVGGSGADVFVFASTGEKTVADFQNDLDLVSVNTASEFSELTITQEGEDVRVEYGDTQFVFLEIDRNDLDEDDFLF